jgi:hypothetical protein
MLGAAEHDFVFIHHTRLGTLQQRPLISAEITGDFS